MGLNLIFHNKYFSYFYSYFLYVIIKVKFKNICILLWKKDSKKNRKQINEINDFFYHLIYFCQKCLNSILKKYIFSTLKKENYSYLRDFLFYNYPPINFVHQLWNFTSFTTSGCLVTRNNYTYWSSLPPQNCFDKDILTS